MLLSAAIDFSNHRGVSTASSPLDETAPLQPPPFSTSAPRPTTVKRSRQGGDENEMVYPTPTHTSHHGTGAGRGGGTKGEGKRKVGRPRKMGRMVEKPRKHAEEEEDGDSEGIIVVDDDSDADGAGEGEGEDAASVGAVRLHHPPASSSSSSSMTTATAAASGAILSSDGRCQYMFRFEGRGRPPASAMLTRQTAISALDEGGSFAQVQQLCEGTGVSLVAIKRVSTEAIERRGSAVQEEAERVDEGDAEQGDAGQGEEDEVEVEDSDREEQGEGTQAMKRTGVSGHAHGGGHKGAARWYAATAPGGRPSHCVLKWPTAGRPSAADLAARDTAVKALDAGEDWDVVQRMCAAHVQLVVVKPKGRHPPAAVAPPRTAAQPPPRAPAATPHRTGRGESGPRTAQPLQPLPPLPQRVEPIRVSAHGVQRVLVDGQERFYTPGSPPGQYHYFAFTSPGAPGAAALATRSSLVSALLDGVSIEQVRALAEDTDVVLCTASSSPSPSSCTAPPPSAAAAASSRGQALGL